MAIDKERKQELVQQYTDLLERSRAVILTDFQGLSVAQITQLRNQIREANGVYHVTKNTLIKLAMEKASLSVPDDWLQGPTAIGFCLDEVPEVAKVIAEFSKESEILAIKGALLAGQRADVAKVKALAELPPTEVLRAQVLGALTAPVSGLIGVFDGLLTGLVGVLEARREQLGEAEPA